MLVVALLGFVVNGVAVWLLHGVRDGSLNVRGAYLHVLGDMLASGGTVVAAVIIRFTGWLGADPIASLLTTVLIIAGAWRLVRESVDVLLEAAPAHIALDAVRTKLESIPNVESVHDLHVWTVTSGMVAMSAHAIVRDAGRPPGGARTGPRSPSGDGHPARHDSARVRGARAGAAAAPAPVRRANSARSPTARCDPKKGDRLAGASSLGSGVGLRRWSLESDRSSPSSSPRALEYSSRSA